MKDCTDLDLFVLPGSGEASARGRLVHVMTSPVSLRFLWGQVGFMKERELELTIVTGPGAELSVFGEREGVATESVDLTRRITPLRDLRALLQLLKLMRRVRPNIVHSHTPKGGLLGMLAAWLLRVQVRIYHMRGLPVLTASGVERSILIWSERLACACAHRVLCVGPSLRKEAISLGLCDPGKIRVLLNGSGNGVDALGAFDPGRRDSTGIEAVRLELGIPTGSLVVGFVGRLVKAKGVVELAEAWRALRDDFPHLVLLIVGGVEDRDRIPTETQTLLAQDPRIFSPGPDWSPARFYAAMDVVAVPSYREGFPNVPLEAAAMGLPVVASRIPGCTDAIVDGETGILVPCGDPVALAQGLRMYIENPNLRRSHGQSGRERVLSDFRPEDIWAAIYGEYQDLLNGVSDGR